MFATDMDLLILIKRDARHRLASRAGVHSHRKRDVHVADGTGSHEVLPDQVLHGNRRFGECAVGCPRDDNDGAKSRPSVCAHNPVYV